MTRMFFGACIITSSLAHIACTSSTPVKDMDVSDEKVTARKGAFEAQLSKRVRINGELSQFSGGQTSSLSLQGWETPSSNANNHPAAPAPIGDIFSYGNIQITQTAELDTDFDVFYANAGIDFTFHQNGNFDMYLGWYYQYQDIEISITQQDSFNQHLEGEKGRAYGLTLGARYQFNNKFRAEILHKNDTGYGSHISTFKLSYLIINPVGLLIERSKYQYEDNRYQSRLTLDAEMWTMGLNIIF